MICKVFRRSILNPEKIEREINDWLDDVDDSIETELVIYNVCQTQNDNELTITIFYSFKNL